MKTVVKQNIALLIVQLTLWLVVMLAPAGVSYMLDPSVPRHWIFLSQSMGILMPMFVVYMISFYVFVPYLFFKGHKTWYLVVTLVLVVLVNHRYWTADLSMLPAIAKDGFYVWLGISSFIHLIVALAAFAMRNYLRSHRIQMELQEERRKSAEAELTWLKNQLNPHFLFNSLNNISSLTQIDPDEAQEAIAQLSDLLRYALYESNKPLVPLAGEVEFMHNYISMMRLRCPASTVVEEEMGVRGGDQGADASQLQIAPLLFISFIENAFKHGTSNSQPSHIVIRLRVEEGKIVFECQNTNFPKNDNDRSGSGVGLENTRRRLDLLYPGRYLWRQALEEDIYRVCVTLNP